MIRRPFSGSRKIVLKKKILIIIPNDPSTPVPLEKKGEISIIIRLKKVEGERYEPTDHCRILILSLHQTQSELLHRAKIKTSAEDVSSTYLHSE